MHRLKKLMLTLVNQPLFADGFESGDKSRWASTVGDGALIAVTTAAALVGKYGLAINITSVTARYVTDTTPNAEKVYRCRFYIHTNSLTMASGDEFLILEAFSIGLGFDAFLVKLHRSATSYQIFVYANNDLGGSIGFTFWDISDGRHYIEVEWAASTAAGANNGVLGLYVDGVLVYRINNGDNDTWSVDTILFGATGEIDVGTTGTFYLDQFTSNNNGAWIGP